jgi:hypothetical protein
MSKTQAFSSHMFSHYRISDIFPQQQPTQAFSSSSVHNSQHKPFPQVQYTTANTSLFTSSVHNRISDIFPQQQPTQAFSQVQYTTAPLNCYSCPPIALPPWHELHALRFFHVQDKGMIQFHRILTGITILLAT